MLHLFGLEAFNLELKPTGEEEEEMEGKEDETVHLQCSLNHNTCLYVHVHVYVLVGGILQFVSCTIKSPLSNIHLYVHPSLHFHVLLQTEIHFIKL